MLLQELLEIYEASQNLCEANWGENAVEFKKLTDEEMPNSGDGNSKLTQWLVAVNKLIYKWYNDGDMYDTSNGHLTGWANDISGSANWLHNHMKNEYKSILDKVFKAANEKDYQKIIDQLEDKSEEIAKNKEMVEKLKKSPKVGDPYGEDGPYEFVEDEPEDEDDYDEED